MIKFDFIDLNNFDETGYCLLKNYFSKDDINLLINSYKNNKAYMENNTGYYSLVIPDFLTIKKIFPKLSFIANTISELTTTKVNQICSDYAFPETRKIKYNFHQEHDPWYTFQQLHNYIILYIPIIKPDENKSGLDIVPFNQLKKVLTHKEFDTIIGQGANTYFPVGDCTVQMNDSIDENFMLNFDIEKIKITPSLKVGDVLVMRGDLIHRTQDVETDRVSLSIRFIDKNTVIDKNQLLSGGEKKKKYVFESLLNKRILKFFQNEKTDKLTAEQIFGEFHKSFL